MTFLNQTKLIRFVKIIEPRADKILEALSRRCVIVYDISNFVSSYIYLFFGKNFGFWVE